MRRVFKKGEKIVEKGQVGNKFFIVLYGVARVTLEEVWDGIEGARVTLEEVWYGIEGVVCEVVCGVVCEVVCGVK